MKLTMGQIINGYDTLIKLKDEKLPIKLAIAHVANTKALTEQVKTYDEKRMELITEYAQKDENGEIVREGDKIPLTNPQEFNIKIQELLEAEIETLITTVPIDAFGNAKISAAELMALDFMIEK